MNPDPLQLPDAHGHHASPRHASPRHASRRRRLPARIRGLALVTVAAVLIAACSGAADSGPAAGPPVPDVAFTTFDGGSTSLPEFDKEPLVVNFWASWCPPCLAEMSDFEQVHQERAGEVTFIGVNTQDSIEAARTMADQTGVTYLLALDPDGELFRAFEVASMPSTYFVDRDGRIRHRHAGLMTAEQLRQAIDEHLR